MDVCEEAGVGCEDWSSMSWEQQDGLGAGFCGDLSEMNWQDSLSELSNMAATFNMNSTGVLAANAAAYQAEVASQHAASLANQATGLAQWVQHLWKHLFTLYGKVAELEEWKSRTLEDLCKLREEHRLLRLKLDLKLEEDAELRGEHRLLAKPKHVATVQELRGARSVPPGNWDAAAAAMAVRVATSMASSGTASGAPLFPVWAPQSLAHKQTPVAQSRMSTPMAVPAEAPPAQPHPKFPCTSVQNGVQTWQLEPPPREEHVSEILTPSLPPQPVSLAEDKVATRIPSPLRPPGLESFLPPTNAATAINDDQTECKPKDDLGDGALEGVKVSGGKAEWRICHLSTKLRSCMGRALVSSPFAIRGLADLRLMIFPDGRDSPKSRNRRQKELYTKKVIDGPLDGCLKLKVPQCPAPHVLEYYLSIGSARRGPFVHNFAESAVNGVSDFGVDWLKHLDNDQSLTVAVEIMKIGDGEVVSEG